MPYIKPEVFNYDVHKMPQQILIFSHINLTHIVALYFLKINFIAIFRLLKQRSHVVSAPQIFLLQVCINLPS